jgi:large subunit ribosomal protein L35
MSSCQKATRPFTQCLRAKPPTSHPARQFRAISSTPRTNNDTVLESASEGTVSYNPATVTSTKGENALMRSGVLPIGSRRRRAALKSSDNIPFEKLPYQCFQEALKVLKKDREEKIEQIKTERLRISNLEAQDVSTINGGEARRQSRLDSMRRHLEYLKIQADINDPLIKKRFEDGEGMQHQLLFRLYFNTNVHLGDMSKPIYRYIAERKWREYQRLIIVQRINQLGLVPDVLPHFEPTAEVRVAFNTRNVQPGEFVDSRVSEGPARLKVQVFDKGERLVTIAVVDSDVPIVEKDSFTSRCHFLATNITLSPTQSSLPLSRVQDSQLVLSWLPPFAQKGSPYHRYSIFVLEQLPGQTFNTTELKEIVKRDKFSVRSFVDKHGVKPIGVGIFRSLWDEGTAGVMQRAGVEGADVEFTRKRIAPLKPKEKAKGWEARHSSTKYRAVWGPRWR